MRIVLVFNNYKWSSVNKKLDELKKWYKPLVDIDFHIKYTNFNDIPFEPYNNDSTTLGVSFDWFYKNITPLGVGYDMVMLILPRKQWQEPNRARGWRTSNSFGAVNLQIACEENESIWFPNMGWQDSFFQLARHEILHGLFMISGQYDTTHYWWDRGQLETARDQIRLPENYSIPGILKAINYISNQITKLTISKQSAGDRIYNFAKTLIGKDASPNNLAPDELACAETVSYILKSLYPTFPIITGTWTLWDYLKKSKDFTEVLIPKKGDIIISPTGTGNGKITGHTGFLGENGVILSNNSSTGKLDNHFTQTTWKGRYQGLGGLPIYYFRKND